MNFLINLMMEVSKGQYITNYGLRMKHTQNYFSSIVPVFSSFVITFGLINHDAFLELQIKLNLDPTHNFLLMRLNLLFGTENTKLTRGTTLKILEIYILHEA